MEIINLTPHAIVLNDGTKFEPSGLIARVASELTVSSVVDGIPLFRQTFGEVEGLPAETPNTMYIVSAMVLNAVDRKDCIAPATSHKDVVRNEAGHIVSVPGFVVK